jgi:hypothetical protein
MSTSSWKFSLSIGILCGFTSFLNLYNSAVREEGSEIDLLRGTSAYVKQYKGESPRAALDYTQTTLEIVKCNENLRESANKLEKEVKDINSQIGDSKNPGVYAPVLQDVGAKIDGILKDKARSPESLPFGVLCGACGLISLGLAAKQFQEKQN